MLRDSVSLSGSAAGLLGDLGQVASSFCASVSLVCKTVIIIIMRYSPPGKKKKKKRFPDPFETY